MTEITTTDQRLETVRASSSPSIPARGRPVQGDAVDIYRVTDDGQISEKWP